MRVEPMIAVTYMGGCLHYRHARFTIVTTSGLALEIRSCRLFAR